MNDLKGNKYYAVCERMFDWFKRNNYRGIDPYLVDQKFSRYMRKFPTITKVRSLLKPLHSFIPRQLFKSFNPIVIPGALGMIISGNNVLYKFKKKEKYLMENYKLIKLLKEYRYKNSQYLCWGWPFEWGGVYRYPPNYPSACVTSPIGLVLLDLYEINHNGNLLNLAENIAQFLIKENGYENFGDSICFYYTALDKFLIPNANALAGVFLLKLGKLVGNKIYYELGTKAVKFVVEEQNKDGSWYYSSKVRTYKNFSIDNRHTNTLLRALKISNDILKDKDIGIALKKGYAFHKEKLFEGIIPRHDLSSKAYPCDIHDVALSIATAVEFGEYEFAEELIDFAISKFFNGKDEFYFKLFRHNKINKTVFIRWNQSRMYEALALFLERTNLNNKA